MARLRYVLRDETLNMLRWNWGEAYEITVASGVWRAVRYDNQRTIVATDPDGLRTLIVADYANQPVPRDRGQSGH